MPHAKKNMLTVEFTFESFKRLQNSSTSWINVWHMLQCNNRHASFCNRINDYEGTITHLKPDAQLDRKAVQIWPEGMISSKRNQCSGRAEFARLPSGLSGLSVSARRTGCSITQQKVPEPVLLFTVFRKQRSWTICARTTTSVISSRSCRSIVTKKKI